MITAITTKSKNSDAGKFVNRVLACVKKYNESDRPALMQICVYPYKALPLFKHGGNPIHECPTGEVPVTAVWTDGRLYLTYFGDFQDLLNVIAETRGISGIITPNEFLAKCYRGGDGQTGYFYAIPMDERCELGTPCPNMLNVFNEELPNVNRAADREYRTVPAFAFRTEQFFFDTKKAYKLGSTSEVSYQQQHFYFIDVGRQTYVRLTSNLGIGSLPVSMEREDAQYDNGDDNADME